jgi:hypothetical protein
MGSPISRVTEKKKASRKHATWNTTTANDDPLNQPIEAKNDVSAAHETAAAESDKELRTKELEYGRGGSLDHETASNNEVRRHMPTITHDRIIAHNIALAEHYKKWGIKPGPGGSLADVK